MPPDDGSFSYEDAFPDPTGAGSFSYEEAFPKPDKAAPAPEPEPTSLGSAKALATGVAKGVTQLGALPGDVGELGTALGRWGAKKLFGRTEEEQQAFEKNQPQWLKDIKTRMYPTSPELQGEIEKATGEWHKPANEEERMMEGIGTFVPGALAGGEGLASNLVRGAGAPAIGSETMGELAKKYVPSWETPARILGSFTDPAAVLAVRGGQKAVGAGKNYLLRSEASQEAAAGKKLYDATQDQDAALAAAQAHQDVIPGSQQMTGAATGDPGLLALEREVGTASPADFKERWAQQNAARTAQLEGLASGDPAAVATHVKAERDAVDHAHELIEQQAQTQAQEAARALPGEERPEVIGGRMRDALEAAKSIVKQRTSSLWRSIDPDGSLTVDVNPTVQAAKDVAREISPNAAFGLTSDEQAIQKAIRSLPARVVPFRDLDQIRQDISTAARRARYGPEADEAAVRRLRILRNSIDDSIDASVSNRVAEETAEVNAGRRSAEDTIGARLERDRAEWAGRQARGDLAANDPGATPLPTRAVPTTPRTEILERPRDVGRDRGLPANLEEPNFPVEAQARAEQARAATAEQKTVYNRSAVGPLLRSKGVAGEYTVGDAMVPGKVVKPGPAGQQSVTDYLRATHGEEGALEALRDAFGISMRRYAMENGVINPDRLARWMARHEDALAVAPGLRREFENAASATQRVREAMVNRANAMNAQRQGVAGKLLGADVTDPSSVARIVGGALKTQNRVEQMRALMGRVSGNADAVEGLQRAVLDHIIEVATGTKEAGTSGLKQLSAAKIQGMVDKNRAALAEVMTPQQIQHLEQIAKDITMAERSMNATRIGGQSNTPQDIIKTLREGPKAKGSLLYEAMTAGGLLMSGHPIGAMGALGSGAGKIWLQNMHHAGMEKVADLVKQAILDPRMYADLMSKAPQRNRQAQRAFQAAMDRAATRSINTSTQIMGRAHGGRVSEAQKEAGNYKKHHMRLHGLPISIENRKGSIREGKNGSWRVKMPHHYGYIKGTEGADGDHVDAYVGPDRESRKVYVVDQQNPDTKRFDENKVMLGFGSKGEALKGYKEAFSDGRGAQRIKSVAEMDVDEFKSWLKGATDKPAA